MSDDVWDVHGVTVVQKQMPSGPTWQWDIEGREGLVLHHEIQWVQNARRWIRRTSVSDPETEGGWNAYPAGYKKVYNDVAAAKVVRELLEYELGPEGADLP